LHYNIDLLRNCSHAQAFILPEIILIIKVFWRKELNMTTQENPMGSIYILSQAIKTVARNAALQAYGVISLTPGNVEESVTRFFDKDADFGVIVKSEEDGVSLELNLIIEYGLRIKTVVDLVAESVKYAVEKTMAVPVKRVDVHVRGLRVSNPD